MRVLAVLGRLFGFGLMFLAIATLSALTWLRWDANKPRDAWFDTRQGVHVSVTAEPSKAPFGQLTERVALESETGLRVGIRVMREADTIHPLPVLLVLGGHRTGSDAVDLFGDVGARAVIGIDYPYAGPEKVRGVGQALKTIPQARQAILDTVPAVSLVIDWVADQPWADRQRIIIIGASLGVPFAAASAARDERIAGAMLVHGAADNRLWLEAQLARRVDAQPLQRPLSVILHWIAYGPAFDTGRHVGAIAPRPVVIVGARDDERTPAGQAELLFELAGRPKRLRWTDGAHIEPDRPEIIAELLHIADEEMKFLTAL